jgi:hypothetical protein
MGNGGMGCAQGTRLITFSLCHFVQGDPYLAQRTDGRRVSFVVVSDREPLTNSICPFLGASYISPGDEGF